MKVALAFALGGLAFAACSATRLPPGTPPPEYEPPQITPWSPKDGDGGTAPKEPNEPNEPNEPKAGDGPNAAILPGPDPELSLDAGPR